MGISQYDPAAAGKPAWNSGRQVGAKRALKVRQKWSMRFFLDREGRIRDRALFDLAIDSRLRGCDLVKIKIGTLVAGPAIRTQSMVIHQKTGRPVQFEITSDTSQPARRSQIDALEALLLVDPEGQSNEAPCIKLGRGAPKHWPPKAR